VTRLLGLDVGDRRIGVAVGDTETRLATPLRTVARSAKPELDVATIVRLAGEEAAEALVVGLPLTESGEVGSQARAVRSFAGRLARDLHLPIHWQDERYSTFEAAQRLGPAGGSRQRQRKRREEELDAMAAAIILQTYLDAG
jgi:putative Holliday junction resolvase